MTKKALGYLVAATVVALGLSGCFRLTQTYTLHEDDTVSGTIVIAVEQQYADQGGLDQLMGDSNPADTFSSAVVTDYNQDGYVGTQITFDNEQLSKLASDSEDFTIKRDGDTFVVDGTLIPQDQYFEGADVSLSVTFPGAVAEHNGTLVGNTVTWSAKDGQFEVHAVGSAIGGGGGSIPPLVWIVLALVVVGGAAAFLIVRSRKPGDVPETLGTPEPPQAPTA